MTTKRQVRCQVSLISTFNLEQERLGGSVVFPTTYSPLHVCVIQPSDHHFIARPKDKTALYPSQSFPCFPYHPLRHGNTRSTYPQEYCPAITSYQCPFGAHNWHSQHLLPPAQSTILTSCHSGLGQEHCTSYYCHSTSHYAVRGPLTQSSHSH